MSWIDAAMIGLIIGYVIHTTAFYLLLYRIERLVMSLQEKEEVE